MDLLIGQVDFWNENLVELVEDKKSEALSIQQLLSSIDVVFSQARME